MFKKKIRVNIKVVPTEGKTTTISKEVAVSGTSLKKVLEAAGISSEKRDFLVNGKPATLDTHIGSDDVVEEAKSEAPYRRPGVNVEVAERPRGS